MIIPHKKLNQMTVKCWSFTNHNILVREMILLIIAEIQSTTSTKHKKVKDESSQGRQFLETSTISVNQTPPNSIEEALINTRNTIS